MTYQRYAIYYCPPQASDWAQFCTRWLGWDMQQGTTVAHPDLADLPLTVSEMTQTPRKYGLHATLKPPFRLATGTTLEDLEAGCVALARDQAPLKLDALAVTRLGRFLALCPDEPTPELNALAERCVRDFDGFRAPLTDAEVERRQGAGLSAQQTHYLEQWGYPYVLTLFRFHITLTGRLPKPALYEVKTALSAALAPRLPIPFEIADIALVGDDAAGRFHLLRRFELTGTA